MNDLLNGMPRIVGEEDFVEYFLFPLINSSNENEEETFLNDLLEKCIQIVSNLSENHLWHKDKFMLIPKTTTTKLISDNQINVNLPPHLYGLVHFGENIEDEWLIVYLLVELTKQIPNLIIKVCDSDGEFLLIEAADYLPQWIKPESVENRVYLYEGKLHLLKPELYNDSNLKSIDQAIKILRDNIKETEASKDIQNAIFKKINGYPSKIKENLHTSRVFVPIGVANILKHEPSLISAAVHAFCNRDPIDSKVLKAMKFFPPENRVYINVTFPKCLYAMISHSKYIPDRRIGWNLPASKNSDFKSHNLGIRLACGFEILVSQAKPNENLDNNKYWQKYLNSLKKISYFNDNIEYSLEYNNLLEKAKRYFLNHMNTMYIPSSIGNKILDHLKNSENNVDDYKNAEQDLDKEDDDSWLNVSSEELDKYLQEKYGQKKINSFNGNSDASNFTEKFTSFLNHVSDIEGAEFPDIPISSTNLNNSDTNTNKINFDANNFSSAVENILNFVIPEDDGWDLESDSEMSEYEDDNFVKNDSYDVKNSMQTYMEEMDKELAATTIGESFIKKDGNDCNDSETVDINTNTLQNILYSYKSQLGEAGPSSNLLGSMGINLESSNT